MIAEATTAYPQFQSRRDHFAQREDGHRQRLGRDLFCRWQVL
jgi:hypothetical protein